MFMVKFSPTAINFGYDFVLLVHFLDILYFAHYFIRSWFYKLFWLFYQFHIFQVIVFDHNHISANRPFWKGQQNTSLKKRVTPWSKCHVIYWVGEYKSPFQMNISNISSVLLWSQCKGHIISSVTQRWLAYACFPLILQVNNFHKYHCHHCQVLVLISRFDGWYCQSMLVLDVFHFRAKWLIHFGWQPA